jgi:hypothetical protein
MLHWGFCLHGSLVDLLISFKHYLFFFLDSFGKFQHESYVGMWGHYGSRVMGIYSRPFSGALSLIIDLV